MPLFEMVRARQGAVGDGFDALSEGIAVVDDEGRVRRSNRALADLLNTPLRTLSAPRWARRSWQADALQELLAATRRGDRPAPLVARSRGGCGARPRQAAAFRAPRPSRASS